MVRKLNEDYNDSLSNVDRHELIRDNIVEPIANALDMSYDYREVFDTYPYEYSFGDYETDDYIIEIKHNEKGTSVIFDMSYTDPKLWRDGITMTFRLRADDSYDDIIRRCKTITNKMIKLYEKKLNNS